MAEKLDQIDENGLFNDYTMQSLLDELDTIEYYQQPGKSHHLLEITQKQRKLYELMDVPAQGDPWYKMTEL